MALLIKDQRLRNMFMGFAQQWREAAQEAKRCRSARSSEALAGLARVIRHLAKQVPITSMLATKCHR
jgi:hypothetical protein